MFDKPWKELTIIDNFIFLKVFSNKEIFKKFILYLLNKRIKLLEYKKEPETEKSIDSYFGSKSVRLDVYCETKNQYFDVEMQTSNKKEDPLPLRSRSYQSNIDQLILQKGNHYEKLKNLYIIFICTFDYIKEKSAIYTIKETIIEFPNSKKWNNRVVKILLNINGDRGTLNKNIVDFLDYCKGLPPKGDFALSVAKEVEKVKINEKYKEEFMTLAEELERRKDEWTKDAVDKTKREMAVDMLRDEKPIEEVVKYTKLPLDVVTKIRANL